MTCLAKLRAPFPAPGGKSAVADEVWRRFGRVRYYVEPFCFSAATLLARPQPVTGLEVINDINAHVVNFWRAVTVDPQAVAMHADWPMCELDIHARGDWLLCRPDREEWADRLRGDPSFFDAKSAGWWVWGQSASIVGAWQESSAGSGKVNRSLPNIHFKRGVIRWSYAEKTSELMRLAERLRGVMVCCGDWQRVLNDKTLESNAPAAVFLDPPYGAAADRDMRIYGPHDSGTVAVDVRHWCLERGHLPHLRIALCGYEGEGHEELESAGWSVFAWKAGGGMGNIKRAGKNTNRGRERIWFSPHCEQPQRMLF